MKFIFLLALIFLTPAHAYKFLCNGMTADGVLDSDNCGVCNDTAASRWPNHTVVFHVNSTVLPSGLSASEWQGLVVGVFEEWALTPDSLLTVTFGGEGTRTFGTDNSKHNLLWMQDSNEWMENVGASPQGILGVTLPIYGCPTSTVAYRAIQDFDMILNAVPSAGFPWHATCSKLSNDCQSILATVAHESGHALGLGHPCTDCQSLMAAQAAYLVEHPLFDDQVGLRALYPGSNTGAVGTACLASSDCQAGLTCHTQSTTQYCSHSCSQSSDCENHMVCTDQFCEFPSGASLGAVGLHESCAQNPCDTTLTCVGVNSAEGYCFLDCTGSQSCAAGETCHQLSDADHNKVNSYACMVEKAQGESCGGVTVCQTGLTCTSGTCVGSSSASSGSKCSGTQTPQTIWILLLLMGILVHRPKKKC